MALALLNVTRPSQCFEDCRSYSASWTGRAVALAELELELELESDSACLGSRLICGRRSEMVRLVKCDGHLLADFVQWSVGSWFWLAVRVEALAGMAIDSRLLWLLLSLS